MSRVLLLLATLLLGACGTSTLLPPPEILSVKPNVIVVNERDVILTVELEAVMPIHVDYAQEQASLSTVRVLLNTTELEDPAVDSDGTLTVAVPDDLERGTYDLRVALSDGREVVREKALEVVTPRDGRGDDGGTVPDEVFDGGILVGDRDTGVTGFEFDPIGELQQSGQSFEVQIRATGPRAARFQHEVTLRLNKRNASVSPTTLGPFTNGRFNARITVTGKGGNMKLTVADEASEAEGTSNGFKVQ